ncbi:unnamed protein product [Durusdinium trenchii]|uniref:Kinesin-like protein KIF13A n=2 Tax=Durusdinium trenchii TaxID=1381693 RepID=A0ABP0L4V8_9DINO
MLTCQKLLGALRCFSSNHSHIDTQIDIRFRKASYASRLRHLPNSSTRETRVYLVDLAGSERAGMHALAPEQLKEGEHINLSLSALGRVVGALASGKCEHVPYRDSALTWLLKDAITGSSARVCMVAAVHPAHPVETASTLRYARQYSALQSTTGSHASQLSSQVRDLQRKVDSLRHAFEKARFWVSVLWAMQGTTLQPYAAVVPERCSNMMQSKT